jgi:hypothetical protein
MIRLSGVAPIIFARGPRGAIGATGPQGPTGETGPAGEPGLGSTGIAEPAVCVALDAGLQVVHGTKTFTDVLGITSGASFVRGFSFADLVTRPALPSSETTFVSGSGSGGLVAPPITISNINNYVDGSSSQPVQCFMYVADVLVDQYGFGFAAVRLKTWYPVITDSPGGYSYSFSPLEVETLWGINQSIFECSAQDGVDHASVLVVSMTAANPCRFSATVTTTYVPFVPPVATSS